MKRFHIHVSVSDLSQSIRFYSTLFGATTPVPIADGVAKSACCVPAANVAAGAQTGCCA